MNTPKTNQAHENAAREHSALAREAGADGRTDDQIFHIVSASQAYRLANMPEEAALCMGAYRYVMAGLVPRAELATAKEEKRADALRAELARMMGEHAKRVDELAEDRKWIGRCADDLQAELDSTGVTRAVVQTVVETLRGMVK